MPLLKEFLNENAHRYYPFVNTNSVPTALILDMGIISTSNLPLEGTYISQIVTDGVQIRFYLAAAVGNTTQDFGCIATVNVETPSAPGGSIGKRTDFSYAGSGYVLEGFIRTGDTTVAQQMPPVTTLTSETGLIYDGCIQHMDHWLSGIQVGDQTLSGLITLVPGAGVEFTVDTNNNAIIIACSGALIPAPNQIIVDDEELVDTVISLYGCPITAINGISVTNGDERGGNWIVATRESDGLVVDVSPDTSSITIRDINAVACCTQNDIMTLVDNLGVLNQRVGTLQNFLTALENNMNTMSAQLARLS